MKRMRNHTVFRYWHTNKVSDDCDWGYDESYLSCEVKNVDSEYVRLRKLYKRIKRRYPYSVSFWEDKNRYVRQYRKLTLSSGLKKQNNKAVRRTQDIPNGNAYRKVRDFLWKYS